jgi:hypothetical protein
MAGTIKKLAGPLALTTTYTTNVYNNASALVYDVISMIHVTNKLLADTFRLYMGATGANAAGTELFFDYPVAAKQSYDWYPRDLKMVSTDFLVGGAATTLTLVITIMGQQYVV